MTLAHFLRCHKGVPWTRWFAWRPVVVATWKPVLTFWGFKRRLAWLEVVQWQRTPCCGLRYQEVEFQRCAMALDFHDGAK